MSRAVHRILKSTSLDEAADLVVESPESAFVIVDEAGHPVGILTRAQIVEGLKRHDSTTEVDTLMQTDIHPVHPETDLLEVIALIQEEGAALFPVVDEADRLVGLVSSETIGRALSVAAHRRNRVDGSPPDTIDPGLAPRSLPPLADGKTKSDVETQ
jgi:CBS domain-containing protein